MRYRILTNRARSGRGGPRGGNGNAATEGPLIDSFTDFLTFVTHIDAGAAPAGSRIGNLLSMCADGLSIDVSAASSVGQETHPLERDLNLQQLLCGRLVHSEVLRLFRAAAARLSSIQSGSSGDDNPHIINTFSICCHVILAVHVLVDPPVMEFVGSVPAADSLIRRFAEVVRRFVDDASPATVCSGNLTEAFTLLLKLARLRVESSVAVADDGGSSVRSALRTFSAMQVLVSFPLSQFIMPHLIQHLQETNDAVNTAAINFGANAVAQVRGRGNGDVSTILSSHDACAELHKDFCAFVCQASKQCLTGRSDTVVGDVATLQEVASSRVSVGSLLALAAALCSLLDTLETTVAELEAAWVSALAAYDAAVRGQANFIIRHIAVPNLAPLPLCAVRSATNPPSLTVRERLGNIGESFTVEEPSQFDTYRSREERVGSFLEDRVDNSLVAATIKKFQDAAIRIGLSYLHITDVVSDTQHRTKRILSAMCNSLSAMYTDAAGAEVQQRNDRRDIAGLLNHFPDSVRGAVAPEVHQLRLQLRKHETRSQSFLMELLHSAVGRIVSTHAALWSAERRQRHHESTSAELGQHFSSQYKYLVAHCEALNVHQRNTTSLYYDRSYDSATLPPALESYVNEYPFDLLVAEVRCAYHAMYNSEQSAIAAVTTERVNKFQSLNLVLVPMGTNARRRSNNNDHHVVEGTAIASENISKVMGEQVPPARSLLLEGRAGIGKTMWAIQLAQLQSDAPSMVVYLRLSGVVQYLEKLNAQARKLLSARELLFVSFGCDASRAGLVDRVFHYARMHNKALLLVFDGLNEVARSVIRHDSNLVESFLEAVTNAVASTPSRVRNPDTDQTVAPLLRPSDFVIITSREERGGVLINPNRIVAINPWLEADAIQFMRNYFKQPSVIESLRARAAQGALGSKAIGLIRNKRFGSISTLPGSLEMLCWYAETSGGNDESLHKFYDYVVNQLLSTDRLAAEIKKICVARSIEQGSNDDGSFVINREEPIGEGIFRSGLVREINGVVPMQTRVTFTHSSYKHYFRAMHFSDNIDSLLNLTETIPPYRSLTALEGANGAVEHIVFTSPDDFLCVTWQGPNVEQFSLELTCLTHTLDSIDIVWLVGDDEKSKYVKARNSRLSRRYSPGNKVSRPWEHPNAPVTRDVTLYPRTTCYLVLRTDKALAAVRCKWTSQNTAAGTSSTTTLSLGQTMPMCDIPQHRQQRIFFQFLAEKAALLTNEKREQILSFLMERLKYHFPRVLLLMTTKAASGTHHSVPDSDTIAESGLNIVVECAHILMPSLLGFGKKLSDGDPDATVCEWALLPCAAHGSLAMWNSIVEAIPRARMAAIKQNDRFLRQSLVGALTGHRRDIAAELTSTTYNATIELPLACKLGAIDVVHREITKKLRLASNAAAHAEDEDLLHSALVDALGAGQQEIANSVWKELAARNTPRVWRLLFDAVRSEGGPVADLSEEGTAWLRAQFKELHQHCGEFKKNSEELALRTFTTRNMHHAVSAKVVTLAAIMNTLNPSLLGSKPTVAAICRNGTGAAQQIVERVHISFAKLAPDLIAHIGESCNYTNILHLHIEDVHRGNDLHVRMTNNVVTAATSLAYASLSRCDLRDLTSLQLPATLNTLKLIDCNVSDDTATSISRCVSLKHLWIKGPLIATPSLLQHLSNTAPLETLCISNNPYFSVDDFVSAAVVRTLTSLTIRKAPCVTDAFLSELPERCPSLTSLDLAGCQSISDTGLDCLSHFASIASLNISFCCGITRSGVVQLQTLTNITSLRLRGCAYVDTAALQDVAQRSLRSIDLAHCQWINNDGVNNLLRTADENPPRRVQSLDVSGCPLVTDGICTFLRMSQGTLTYLAVGGTQFMDSGLGILGTIGTLTSLNLSGCDSITPIGVAHIAMLLKLTSLKMGRCEKAVTDSGLQLLGSALVELRELDVSESKEDLSENGLQHLGSHKALTSLNLSKCRITSNGIRSLSGLDCLTLLDVTDCGDLTNDDIFHIAEHHHNLATLVLDGCTGVTNDGLSHLASLRALTTLGLKSCRAALTRLNVGSLVALTSLDFSSCRSIDDASIESLSSLSLLYELRLTSCVDITDRAVHCICNSFQQLRHLSLKWCLKITSRGLERVSQLALLNHLDVESCPGIDNGGLESISRLAHLQYLDLSRCENISDEGASHFAALKSLQHLDVSSTAMTDAGVIHLSNLEHLRCLSLSNCAAGITGQGLVTLNQLTSLHLSNCHRLDVRHIAGLVKLVSLWLSSCQFNDDNVEELSNLLHLQELDLGGTDITSSGVRTIVAKLPELRKIDLSQCEQVDDYIREMYSHIQR